MAEQKFPQEWTHAPAGEVLPEATIEVMKKYGVEDAATLSIVGGLALMFDNEARRVLAEDPDAMTWCNQCGNRCRLDETNIHGYCC